MHHPNHAARTRAVAGTALLLLAVLTSGVFSSPSGADTTGNPDPVVTATVGGQAGVAPGGTLTGLTDGTSISITATSAGNLAGVDARQCRTGVDIMFAASFNPTQGGNCIDVPLSPNSDDLVVAPTEPPNSTVTFSFRVGVGTRTVAFGSGGSQSRVITCDEATDCALWLKVSVFTGGDFSGSVWKHYTLDFGPAVTTTSSTSSTTTTTAPDGSTTTSTTAPDGSTTTTAPDGSTTTSTTAETTTTTSTAPTTTTTTLPATTTTTAPATTTTAAPGTTTSTTAPATTTSTTRASTTTSSTSSSSSTSTTAAGGSTTSTSTTLPAGTTVSPTVAPGGTITVSSPGWKPGDPVTGTLRSDPVNLGALTADATGMIAGTFTVPATVAPGAHELELAGTSSTGQPRSVKAGVTVVAASSSTTAAGGSTTSTSPTSGSGGLARTGASSAQLFLTGVLLVAAGGLFVESARLHRAHPGR